MKGRKSQSPFLERIKEMDAEKSKEKKVGASDQAAEKKGEEEEKQGLSERLGLTKNERAATTSQDPMYSVIDYDENMAIAYLVRKMPETFSVALRVLVELKYRFPKQQLKSVLDYGAGLGSFGMAFADLFPVHDFIVNVEPATAMRKLGKYLSQDFKNTTWVSTLSETLRFEHHKTFDLVSVCNVLEEIPTPERRLC